MPETKILQMVDPDAKEKGAFAVRSLCIGRTVWPFHDVIDPFLVMIKDEIVIRADRSEPRTIGVFLRKRTDV